MPLKNFITLKKCSHILQKNGHDISEKCSTRVKNDHYVIRNDQCAFYKCWTCISGKCSTCMSTKFNVYLKKVNMYLENKKIATRKNTQRKPMKLDWENTQKNKREINSAEASKPIHTYPLKLVKTASRKTRMSSR